MNRVLQLFSRSVGTVMALTAVACGGGGGGMQQAGCGSELARLCDGLDAGGTTTIPSGTAPSAILFTTAPTSITLASGGNATYTIGGGTAPYTATSGNTGVVTTSVSGTSLTVNAASPGTAPVVVVDAVGKQVSIGVTVSAVQLFTTAPTSITLASGGSATYTIGGGTAPYTATSGNTGVVTASVSGTSLTLTAVSAGTAPVVVVDAAGKQVPIAVSVLSKQATGLPLSVFPGSITVSDCTTNIPFVFTGGTAPYTVYTSDNQGVPVTSPLPLGADSYFMASIKNPSMTPYTATLTVMDGQSRTAVTKVTIDYPLVCSANSLQEVSPASANARESEILSFVISGGSGTYNDIKVSYQTNSQANVTTILRTGPNTFDLRADAVGSALITITGTDGQKTNLVFTVLPRMERI